MYRMGSTYTRVYTRIPFVSAIKLITVEIRVSLFTSREMRKTTFHSVLRINVVLFVNVNANLIKKITYRYVAGNYIVFKDSPLRVLFNIFEFSHF